MTSIVQFLASRRQQEGLSIKGMAGRIGMTEQGYRNIELGRTRVPNIGTFQKIVAAFPDAQLEKPERTPVGAGLAEFLHKHMMDNGLKQYQLSEKLGIQPSQLQRYLNKGQIPRKKCLDRFEAVIPGIAQAAKDAPPAPHDRRPAKETKSTKDVFIRNHNMIAEIRQKLRDGMASLDEVEKALALGSALKELMTGLYKK